jgi:hypothetical protein
VQPHRDVELRQRPEVYITCMSPRNHADCVGNYCDAVLSGHFRSLLAQFGLMPKSKRGWAASDPGEALDWLDVL